MNFLGNFYQSCAGEINNKCRKGRGIKPKEMGDISPKSLVGKLHSRGSEPNWVSSCFSFDLRPAQYSLSRWSRSQTSLTARGNPGSKRENDIERFEKQVTDARERRR